MRQVAVVVAALCLVPHAVTAGQRRFEVSVAVGTALGTSDWRSSSSWEQSAEAADLQAAYEAGAGPALEAALGVGLTPRVALRAAFGWAQRDGDASIHALVPHPFFFDRARGLEARVPGLEYRQWASHLEVVWRSLRGPLEVAVFGGVCLSRVEADLVERVEIDEHYPYDEASFRAAVTQRRQSNVGVGWSAGAAVSHALGSRLGLAAQARYTRVTVELPPSDRQPARLLAGGLQLTASLGLRF